MNITARLVRAELLKARTSRLLWGLAAGTFACAAAATISSILQSDHHGDLATRSAARNILTSAGWGVMLMQVFGIIAIAGEFRHNTIITTLHVTPSPLRVLSTKMIRMALIGA